jgi:hypothetical protein
LKVRRPVECWLELSGYRYFPREMVRMDLLLVASKSRIITSAHRINQGSIPDLINPAEASGRSCWLPEEGRRDRGTQRFEQTAVVEDGRVAAPPPATFEAGRHGGLSISSFCANFRRRSARNRIIETNAAAMRGYPPAVAKTSRVAGNATAASIASINRSRDSHAAI